MTTASRKAIPVGVKLHAALLLLGFTDDDIAGGIAWDHSPALALRFVDPETGKLVPEANDPHFLQPLRTADHRTKTCGRRGEARSTSAGSDQNRIAKIDRLAPEHEEFRRRMLTKGEREKPVAAKLKRAWPSRPMNRRKA